MELTNISVSDQLFSNFSLSEMIVAEINLFIKYITLLLVVVFLMGIGILINNIVRKPEVITFSSTRSRIKKWLPLRADVPLA